MQYSCHRGGGEAGLAQDPLQTVHPARHFGSLSGPCAGRTASRWLYVCMCGCFVEIVCWVSRGTTTTARESRKKSTPRCPGRETEGAGTHTHIRRGRGG